MKLKGMVGEMSGVMVLEVQFLVRRNGDGEKNSHLCIKTRKQWK